ncbi:RNase H domain-containing protein [Hirsutella rhossiliensis]|uniref:ribonuclease H n=1 Tax=Hirsutella rhossiliensis TaxID=111463 RepID=A0A9P8MPP8_9HYPO|nr:RNase H domain-containing protein [Hirsutella rhossiliensis]KAH0956967.1 RNase H domain-containing protein [Hirsutella rhossiliensis]
MELFRGRVRFMNIVRCTYPNDKSMLLIMTDGACLNNGQSNPKAGWAFVQGLHIEGQPLVVSGRLEKQGPWGDDGIQSSNRAELRAVIAALRFRHWPGEGFSTVIIATDSEYVVEGSTQWAKAWVQNNWRTKGKKGAAATSEQGLVEMLLGSVRKMLPPEETPVEWKDCLGLAI